MCGAAPAAGCGGNVRSGRFRASALTPYRFRGFEHRPPAWRGPRDERWMALTRVWMGTGPKPFPRDISAAARQCGARANACALSSACPGLVNVRRRACWSRKRGRDPTLQPRLTPLRRWGGAHRPRSSNFSTAQTFMSTIFLQLFGSEQAGRMTMNRIRVGLGCAVALVLGVSSASAQGTVKIGLINVLSGQFADAGIQLDNGVKTYMKQHGDTVAGKKIEIIRRDVGGPAPDVAKRFAQELV